ncbi:MAG: hypothetical protein GXO89_08055 [Chlorobi bacterium]|nr:hypothetical protein [Chlorobiota bacterium]
MKNILSGFVLFVSASILLASCGSYTTLTGNIKTDASKKNETVKSSELKSYLAEKDRIKFVGWNYGNIKYKSLTHTYDMNDQSRRKAIERLVKALLSELKPKE